MQWHPPDGSMQARNIQSGINARSNRRGTGTIAASPVKSSATALHRGSSAELMLNCPLHAEIEAFVKH